ncbi:hypothetical protein OG373_33630 [Streptomyces avidinii]|uniref:hypothetical protein n=1 Tax=Streptomyces avidinii TaxID=1895 RepID=UPI003864E170|nr:hypothetical protein OG373_33630 [Streptomyces avidinii]
MRTPRHRAADPARGRGDWSGRRLEPDGAARAVHKGREALTTLAPAAGAALLLVAGLTVLGLRPRLAEFS